MAFLSLPEEACMPGKSFDDSESTPCSRARGGKGGTAITGPDLAEPHLYIKGGRLKDTVKNQVTPGC